jgi:Carboxymuconolactone decarboxylase family
MADDDALFRKGMPIRREVLGPDYVDASMARADEFMMSFQRATTAWAWGWAWGDPTLDRKTRSLMNLAMLTALNRAPEIKLHKARSTTASPSRRSRPPYCTRQPIAAFRPGSTRSGRRTKYWSAKARWASQRHRRPGRTAEVSGRYPSAAEELVRVEGA